VALEKEKRKNKGDIGEVEVMRISKMTFWLLVDSEIIYSEM
jgi:hypothetical protein